MVSLAEVKRDIDLWKEPLEAELQALVQSGTIRRAKADQVPQESGYDYMTVAPAKIVPTIKSPVGKRISAEFFVEILSDPQIMPNLLTLEFRPW